MAKTTRSFDVPAENVVTTAPADEATDASDQIAEDAPAAETAGLIEPIAEDAATNEAAEVTEQIIDVTAIDEAADVTEQIVEDAAPAVEVTVARAPSITREELEAMGLDPAPYGFVSENKSAD